MPWTNTIQNENRFWLQVMGDKARIITNELYTDQTADIAEARSFIVRFDSLLAEARQREEQSELNPQAYQAVQDFRRFVLQLIRTQLQQTTIVGITPSSLSIIVNETEIYLDILYAAMHQTAFTGTAMDVIIVWMVNYVIGSIHLMDNIGATFVEYRDKAEGFSKKFATLYLRAYVMNGMRRTGLEEFAAMDALYNDVAATMTEYAEYVVDLTLMMKKRVVLGTLTMLYLDHYYRLICYFMHKLSSVSNIKPPACDPTAPRIE